MITNLSFPAKRKCHKCKNCKGNPQPGHYPCQTFSGPNGERIHNSHALSTAFLLWCFPTCPQILKRPIPATVAVPIVYGTASSGDPKLLLASLITLALILFAHTLQKGKSVSDARCRPASETVTFLLNGIPSAMFTQLVVVNEGCLDDRAKKDNQEVVGF